ncbi:beta-lactamase family protein [Novosphingobium sp. G106]|uniref:serine hydrolase domain-containing protein n=1 Tax=Novosphingobium sp. G106 TaxID=2849500 RepID=UPI001C2D0124|nr:serine hydrolase [Novosphingobium sp. G106]MBV1690048.1 beta-lactamase family protein [Novosphingobium sp. G106]
MPTRRLPLILPLLALPALAGCGGGDKGPPPLAPAALSAVTTEPGVPREQLARAIDDLFADGQAGETRALLVMSGGRIVAERYGEGYGPSSRLIGWSMSKTITGVMIGQLVADGRLRLNETAPVPAWQRSGDPRGEITLRQLLQMRSGLRHREASSPVYDSDEVRMLFLDGRDDMAAYAEAQPLEADPGRTFEYSSATTVILADIAARALTDNPDPGFRRQAVRDYLHTRLLDPVGMKSAVVEFDAAGTLIGSSMMHATARDWGKFGEFLRNGGAVRGAQLVPRGWVDFMTSPSPRNPAYGAQLWLNRPTKADGDMLFPDRAPQSAFACVGHLGQYVIVSPDQKLTLVRLGKTDGEHRAELRRRLADIVALFPKA